MRLKVPKCEILMSWILMIFYHEVYCAANFLSFAQLAKGKSLGRTKPATNPKHKHRNTLCGIFLLYPSLTEHYKM